MDPKTLSQNEFWAEEAWVLREERARLAGMLGEQQQGLKDLITMIEDFTPLDYTMPPSRMLRSRVHRRLGHTYRVEGQFEKAVSCYHAAIRLLGHQAKGPEGALLLVQLAAVRGRMGKFAQARRDCRFALGRIKGNASPVIYANAFMVLGELELNRGQLPLAEEYFHRALSTYERLKNREGIILILTYLGGVADRLGRTEEAEVCLRRSIREAQGLGNVSRVAMARNNLGNIRFRRGDFSQALREYLGGVEAARRLGDQRLLATSLNNLGNVSRIRGEYGKALEYYRESVLLKKNLGNMRSLCHSQLSYVELLLVLGDIEEAKVLLDSALTLARQSDAKDLEAQANLCMAIMARHLKDDAMVQRRLQEAKTLFGVQDLKQGIIAADLEWCYYLIEQNRGHEVVPLLTRILGFSLEKSSLDFQAQTYLYLGRAEKDEVKSQSYFHLAYKIAQDSGNMEVEWESAFFLGLSLKSTQSQSMVGSGLDLIRNAQDILSEILSGLSATQREHFLNHGVRKACYLFKRAANGDSAESQTPSTAVPAANPDEKTSVLEQPSEKPNPVTAEITRVEAMPAKNLKMVQGEVSRLFLQQAIAQAQGNITLAAKTTGIPRGTFYRLMHRYKVERPET